LAAVPITIFSPSGKSDDREIGIVPSISGPVGEEVLMKRMIGQVGRRAASRRATSFAW
jgi:hypothetical protein